MTSVLIRGLALSKIGGCDRAERCLVRLMMFVCRWKGELKTLCAEVGPYILAGSGRMQPIVGGCRYGRSKGALTHAAAGVDVLSHKKKAAFWRELVELFPNIIDYLCNPNIDPVRHRLCLGAGG